jgi:hypothetical protein
MDDLSTYLGVNNSEDNGEVTNPQNEIENPESTDVDLNDIGGETDSDNADTDNADQQRTSKQTPEQDRAFAELRRKAEKAAQLEAQLAEYQELEKEYEEYGLKGAKAITEAVRREKQNQSAINQSEDIKFNNWIKDEIKRLHNAGYDDMVIEAYVDGKQAKYDNYKFKREIEQKEKLREREVQQKQQAEQQDKVRIQFDSDFKELQSEYPDIKKIEDIASSLSDESHQKLVQKLQRGYSLLDAYESVNRGAVKQKAAAAGRQKALNDQNSKQHLKNAGGGSSDIDTTVVPPEVLKQYKALNPKATMEQIVDDYKKNNPKRR